MCECVLVSDKGHVLQDVRTGYERRRRAGRSIAGRGAGPGCERAGLRPRDPLIGAERMVGMRFSALEQHNIQQCLRRALVYRNRY